MLSAAGDGECEAGLAQTAAPATCTASGSQRVAWSSSRVRSGVLLLVTHGGRRASRQRSAAAQSGGRAASGGSDRVSRLAEGTRETADRQEGGREAGREERGLRESRDEVECRVAGVAGMNAWPAGVAREKKGGRMDVGDRCAGRSKERKKESSKQTSIRRKKSEVGKG
jgi:hypothetical protein